MSLRFTPGRAPEKEVFQVVGETLEALLNEDERVVYLDAHLMGALKTHALWKKYPQRVFNTGIQEANMVGTACGMHLNGFKPYVHSFTAFASRRVFDQLFVSAAYGRKSLRVIASDAGLCATHNGGTHMCFEDVAMMRTVPGACVVDVSDPVMAGAFLRLTRDRPGLTYLRMPRRGLPDIYTPDTVFEEGRGKILREGRDVTLIACGIMVAVCLEAAELLAAKGVEAQVADMVTVKPLDKDLVLACARRTGLIVTAENASVYGGLGGAVAECVCEELPVPVLRMGVNDEFGRVGSEGFLREFYGLTPEHVCRRVLACLNRQNFQPGRPAGDL